MRTPVCFVLLPVLVLAGGASAFASGPDPVLDGWTKEATRSDSRVPHIQVVPATVVKLAVRTNGWWVVTLDNGQVWSQIENRAEAQVAVGDDVTLRRSRIGSYVLTTVKGIETRVKRDR